MCVLQGDWLLKFFQYIMAIILARRYYDVVWIVTDHKRMVSTMVCGPFKGPQTVAAYIHISSQIVSKPQTLNPLDGV